MKLLAVFFVLLFLGVLLFLAGRAMAAPCQVPNTFVAGTVIDPGQMNANFTTVENCAGSNNAANASNINSGILGVTYGGTGNTSGWVQGAVVFATTTTQLGQDPPNLSFNDSSRILNVGNTGANGTIYTGNINLFSNFGSGGRVQMDNNVGIQYKDTGGTYRNGTYIDTANNIHVGDVALNGVCFDTHTSNCVVRLDGSGIFFTNAFHATSIDSTALNSSGSLTISGGATINNTATIHGGITVTGGSVGIDNNQSFVAKDTSNTYRNIAHIDNTTSYVHLGDGNLSVSVDTSGGSCFFNGGTSWSCSSDARLKTTRPLDPDVEARIAQLHPVSFRWTRAPDGPEHLGFTAQDVERVFPELVTTQPDGSKTLEYTGLIAPLVVAVQRLEARVAQLEEELDARKGTSLQRKARSASRPHSGLRAQGGQIGQRG